MKKGLATTLEYKHINKLVAVAPNCVQNDRISEYSGNIQYILLDLFPYFAIQMILGIETQRRAPLTVKCSPLDDRNCPLPNIYN